MYGMRMFLEANVTWLDVVALAFFVVAWIGYAVFSVRHAKDVPSLRTAMDNFRREWMARMINRAARVTSYASVNFNNGLRAYYFALAALTWFLHPWLMIAATGWVVYILYQREFRSKTLMALIEEDTSPTLPT